RCVVTAVSVANSPEAKVFVKTHPQAIQANCWF
ncbi:MAG: hypothetical protein ACI8ZZ_002285, partial [Gammaproteobacteria bacterium]